LTFSALMDAHPSLCWPGCCEASHARGFLEGLSMPEPQPKPKRLLGDVFLRSREWAAVRASFLKTVEPVCVQCGSAVQPNVDHILPRLHYPELALTESNLQVLCWECNRAKSASLESLQ